MDQEVQWDRALNAFTLTLKTADKVEYLQAIHLSNLCKCPGLILTEGKTAFQNTC